MEVDKEEEEEEVGKKSKILCSNGSGSHLMLWFIKRVSNVSFFFTEKEEPKPVTSESGKEFHTKPPGRPMRRQLQLAAIEIAPTEDGEY